MEQLTVRLDKDLLKQAKEIAKLQSRSIASVFREALIIYIKGKGVQ